MSDWRLLEALIPNHYSGSRNGAVVRVVASQQCRPGSIEFPGVDALCWLNLLLILVSALRVFLRVLQFSSLHKNQNLQIIIRPGNSGRIAIRGHSSGCLLPNEMTS